MKTYSTIADRELLTNGEYWNTAEYNRLQQAAWELGFSVTYSGGEYRVNYNSGGDGCTAQYVRTPRSVFKKIKEMEKSPRFNPVWRKYT